MIPFFVSQMNFAKMKSVDTAHLTKQKTPNHKNVYQINLIAQVNFKFMPKYICMSFK